MKEYLDLLIEENRRKQDYFATFISFIEKLPSPTEKNLALHQVNNSIDVYKTFFDKPYYLWIKNLPPLSIAGTPATASTFVPWYPGVTDPDKIELNIGMCEVHKCNVSTTRWRNVLDSLTINPKYFSGYTIVSYQSEMDKLSKGISIYNSEVNEDLMQLQKYCEELIFPLNHHT